MLTIILTIVHVIVSVFLILVILLQTGKGADLGAMFGGGSSNTVFGSTGAGGFLSNMTKYGAVAFMVNCLVLAYLSGQTGSSVIDQLEQDQATQQQAVTPDGTTPAAATDTEAATEAEKAKPADEAKSADAVDAEKASDNPAATEKEAGGEVSDDGASAKVEPPAENAKKSVEPKTDTE